MYSISSNVEGVDLKRAEELLRLCLSKIDIDGDFTVTFVDKDEIRLLNREYRGIDLSTDILTFALDDGPEFPAFIKEKGDIFISLSDMKENADYFSVDLDEELLRLLVHGLLHLNGMDHETNDFKSEEMLILQENIISQILRKK